MGTSHGLCVVEASPRHFLMFLLVLLNFASSRRGFHINFSAQCFYYTICGRHILAPRSSRGHAEMPGFSQMVCPAYSSPGGPLLKPCAGRWTSCPHSTVRCLSPCPLFSLNGTPAPNIYVWFHGPNVTFLLMPVFKYFSCFESFCFLKI